VNAAQNLAPLFAVGSFFALANQRSGQAFGFLVTPEDLSATFSSLAARLNPKSRSRAVSFCRTAEF
jgi:hypothetical protein